MSVSNKLVLLLLTLCCAPLVASADVLMLKDGQAITGDFIGADQATVSFQADGQTRNYRISDVQSITFTSSGARSSPPERSSSERRPAMRRRSEPPSAPAPTYEPQPPADWADRAPADSATSSAPAPRGVSVHAGSLITVRMIDPVDSSVNRVGETFRAALEEPLVVEGETIVPRGADVTARLVSKSEAGRIQGRSELNLALLDITIQGRRYDITTSEVIEAGASRGRQSAERVGAGAAIGAVIGAIAGGGKGAAIGAATGGGVGTAVQVMTHGDKVKIPAETRLQFTLAQPLNM